MINFATYEFYTNTYKGTKITSEEEFERLGGRASLIIRREILNKPVDGFETEVSFATCSVADILFDSEQIQKQIDLLAIEGQGILQNEKVGDYSRSFSNATLDGLLKMVSDSQVNSLIRIELSNYLLFTGLLNRGMIDVR